MKKLLIIVLAAVIGMTAVEAQQLSKRDLKAQKKALQQEIANYQAQGWTVAPGNLSMAEQITRSKTFINALNDNGEPKYVTGEAIAVAQTYKAAMQSALSGVKLNAASQINSEMHALTAADLANVEEANKEAISIDKVVTAARDKVAATLSRGINLVTMHRELKNGNIELRLVYAYDFDRMMDNAKKATRQALQEEIDQLKKQL